MERSALELVTPKGMVPPYVAHKTLINFLNGMHHGVPSRIDRSIMKSFSGAVQGQLIATLCYFDLIDLEGTPNELLFSLVNAEGADRQRLFATVITKAYQFVFGCNLDLKRATRNQIEEVFAKQQVGGETLRKALGLFLALAKDAGLKLSPHITKRSIRPSTSKRQVQALQANDRILNVNSPQIESTPCWSDLLFSIFPPFDPNWSDELKFRWFDAFERLMKQGEHDSIS